MKQIKLFVLILFVILFGVYSMANADIFRGKSGALLEKSGLKQEIIDSQVKLPEEPEITSPAAGATLNSSSISVQGTAAGKIDRIEVRLDSAAWQTATGKESWQFQINNCLNGIHLIKARIVNTKGAGPESSIVVTVAKSAPVVCITNGPRTSITTNNAFTLTLNVKENSGYWSTNGSTFFQFAAGNANILIGHTTTLKFFGKDIYGNTSSTQTRVYSLPPIVSVSFGPSGDLITNIAFNVRLSVSATNGYWSTNSGAFIQFPFVSTNIPITHTMILRFFGKDGLNNSSVTQTNTYIFDLVAPVLTIASGPLGNLSTNKPFTVTLHATENSGYWETNAGLFQQFVAGDKSISIFQSTVLKFYGKDRFGNTSATQTRTYTIDTNTPVVPTTAYPTMISIPAVSSFTMGCPNGETGSGSQALPAYRVNLNEFFISKYEISIEQYALFLNAGGNDDHYHAQMTNALYCGLKKIGPGNYSIVSGRDQYPITYIAWDDAKHYCNWLSGVTGDKYRLPIEAEWEYAAIGTNGNRLYPWGNVWNPALCNWPDSAGASDGYAGSAPITNYPNGQSLSGIFNMAGNVTEWCENWRYDYPAALTLVNEPKGPLTGSQGMIRGGAYMDLDYYTIKSYYRVQLPRNFTNEIIGFRSVMLPAFEAPHNIVGFNATNKINLSWEKNATAEKYYVYKTTNLSKPFVETANVATTNYSDVSVSTQNVSYYKLRSWSSIKGYSAFSYYIPQTLGDWEAPVILIIDGPTVNTTTNLPFTVTLNANDDFGYWSTNNSVYQQFAKGNVTIPIAATTTLKYYGRDVKGNTGSLVSLFYLISVTNTNTFNVVIDGDDASRFRLRYDEGLSWTGAMEQLSPAIWTFIGLTGRSNSGMFKYFIDKNSDATLNGNEQYGATWLDIPYSLDAKTNYFHIKRNIVNINVVGDRSVYKHPRLIHNRIGSGSDTIFTAGFTNCTVTNYYITNTRYGTRSEYEAFNDINSNNMYDWGESIISVNNPIWNHWVGTTNITVTLNTVFITNGTILNPDPSVGTYNNLIVRSNQIYACYANWSSGLKFSFSSNSGTNFLSKDIGPGGNLNAMYVDGKQIRIAHDNGGLYMSFSSNNGQSGNGVLVDSSSRANGDGRYSIVSKGADIFISYFSFGGGGVPVDQRQPLKLARSSDGGTTWSLKTMYSNKFCMNSSMVMSSNTLYLAYNRDGTLIVMKSMNMGTNWITNSIPGFAGSGCKIVASGTKLFVASGSTLHKSVDGGSTWSSVDFTSDYYTGNNNLAVAGSNVYIGYYTSTSFKMAVSTDGGINWTQYLVDNMTSGERDCSVAVSGGVIHALYQHTDGFKYTKSIDGGVHWK